MGSRHRPRAAATPPGAVAARTVAARTVTARTVAALTVTARTVTARTVAALTVTALAGCTSPPPGPAPPGGLARPAPPSAPFQVTEIARLAHPWAMTFLPDGRALVTQQTGELLLVDVGTGASTTVAGVPAVVYAGQGGLGDVVLAPGFAAGGRIYLSWVEGGPDGTSGAAVGRARLVLDGIPRLEGQEVLWRQPKVTGTGHFGHRLAFSPDGTALFVTSGDRQKMDPAQDLASGLGTIVRLTPDGDPAPGNPFAERAGELGPVVAQTWSRGHRNPLGIAHDGAGNLWISEMGPQGGDELNLVLLGRNYGWPRVSNGSHYGGGEIPDHAPGDGFEPPRVWWNPSISPGSLMIYSGALFPQWRGDAFVGALSGQALVRVDLDGTSAVAADRWDLGARIREVEQGPDGAIWLLEDGDRGGLLRLTPAGS